MDSGYFPHQMTRMSSLRRGQGLGEHCSSPGGSGAEPRPKTKTIFVHFLSENRSW